MTFRLLSFLLRPGTLTSFPAQVLLPRTACAKSLSTGVSMAASSSYSSELARLAEHAHLSWVDFLDVDPDHESHTPNQSSRPVKSGHYVPVRPTPLPAPLLIAVSHSLAKELHLDPSKLKEDENVAKYFSGDLNVPLLKDTLGRVSWATPYALAIYGTDYTQQCPFKTGDGYGDGRAISVGEVVVPETNERWEFQLKGAGPTPFCRGADGRAVLRSSVREYLVSEAMHALGVSTTRAFTLVVSQKEIVQRPWYSNSRKMPDLSNFTSGVIPHHVKMMLYAQLRGMTEPDVMVPNKAAITCRAAHSFLRVGHVQLFERRARKAKGTSEEAFRLEQLKKLVEHAFYREYSHITGESLQEKAFTYLYADFFFLDDLTNWIRVGYCQGNFNSDNCLVAGRTMDYGPFGFIEKFQPLWNMWSGGGEHFGFLNQHMAGTKNYQSLCRAMEPLLDEKGVARARELADLHEARAEQALQEMWNLKLGLEPLDTTSFINSLIPILVKTEADYTIFFRELATVAEHSLEATPSALDDKDSILKPLRNAFYEEWNVVEPLLHTWVKVWISHVRERMRKDGTSAKDIAAGMRKVSPKYVPREWMLVDAYTRADKGDYEGIYELEKVFADPYDDQSAEIEKKFYKQAPPEVYDGVGKGGVAYMT